MATIEIDGLSLPSGFTAAQFAANLGTVLKAAFPGATVTITGAPKVSKTTSEALRISSHHFF